MFAAESQISEHLRCVHRQQALYGFDLDYHEVFNQEIDPVRDV